MNLVEGTQFVVVGEKDVLMLKTIEGPVISEFDDLIQQARAQAKIAGLKLSDITNAIKEARGHKWKLSLIPTIISGVFFR